jgi:hypothetical protein
MKFAMVTTAEEVMTAGSSRTREVITEGASVAPASSLGEEGA